MKVCILPSVKVRFAFARRGTVGRVIPLVLGILLNTTPLQGQPTESGADVDKQTIQVLLQRIEQLEATDKQLQDRVTQLEKAQPGPAQGGTVHASSQGGAPVAKQADDQSEPAEPEKMEVGKTLLNIRGFGDFSLHGDNQKGSTTSFSISSTSSSRRMSPSDSNS